MAPALIIFPQVEHHRMTAPLSEHCPEMVYAAVGFKRPGTPREHRCRPGASGWRVFASRSVTSGSATALRSAANMAEKLVGVRGFEPPAPASRRPLARPKSPYLPIA
jgi:hypothetical protein